MEQREASHDIHLAADEPETEPRKDRQDQNGHPSRDDVEGDMTDRDPLCCTCGADGNKNGS